MKTPFELLSKLNIKSGAYLSEEDVISLSGALAYEKLTCAAEAQADDYVFSKEPLTVALAKRIRDDNPGKKIVFTNGCFAILHKGHIASLKAAAALSDVLVVGINSDSSVRLLKGEGRPVLNVTERTALLLSLGFVDYVVCFEEQTPMNLLYELRPDVLVKGGQYNRDTVVGADFVESYGGRIYLADMVDGVSTTQIINSIKSYKLKP
jgi:rfaE bifunctional protein nucleotidyltransferase chain/domain